MKKRKKKKTKFAALQRSSVGFAQELHKAEKKTKKKWERENRQEEEKRSREAAFHMKLKEDEEKKKNLYLLLFREIDLFLVALLGCLHRQHHFDESLAPLCFSGKAEVIDFLPPPTRSAVYIHLRRLLHLFLSPFLSPSLLSPTPEKKNKKRKKEKQKKKKDMSMKKKKKTKTLVDG